MNIRYFFILGILILIPLVLSQGQVNVGIEGPYCGDGTCDNENCSNCPDDCGICPYCGDGTCENNETCSNCPSDCGICPYCGDGTCQNNEDCSTCSADCGVCGGGGGGGGGSGYYIPSTSYTEEEVLGKLKTLGIYFNAFPFEVTRETIKVYLKQGERITESIEMKNHAIMSFDLNIAALDIDNFIDISERIFTLRPNEKKIIYLNFSADEEEMPDAYFGKLIITGEGLRDYINIFVIVSDKESFFNVNSRTAKEYYYSGDEADINLKIVTKEGVTPINITSFISIISLDTNELIVSKKEIMQIDDYYQEVKKLSLPEDISPGDYAVRTSITYENITAFDADKFTVLEIEQPLFSFLVGIPLYMLAIAFIIISGVSLLIIIKIFRAFKRWFIKARESEREKVEAEKKKKVKT